MERLDIGSEGTSCVANASTAWCPEPASFDLLKDSQVDLKLPQIPDFTDMTPINYERKSVEELLQSFQNQLLCFDSERDDYDNRLGDLRDIAQEHFKALKELQRKDADISRLQQSLSDAHVHLYEERAEILALQDENHQLKVENEKLKSEHRMMIGTSQKVIFEERGVPKVILNKGKGRTIRTVYLPTHDISGMQREIDHLQARCADLENLLQTRERAYLQDRQMRSNQVEIREGKMKGEISMLSERLARITNLQYSTMKDYLTLQREFKAKEVNLMGEISEREIENYSRRKWYELGLRKIAEFAQHLRDIGVEQVRLYLKQARKQMVHMREELVTSQDEHLKTKLLLGRKLESMTKKYQKTRKKLKALEVRRRLEIDGFQTDLEFLRKDMRQCEI